MEDFPLNLKPIYYFPGGGSVDKRGISVSGYIPQENFLFPLFILVFQK